MATSGTYVTEVPLKGTAEKHYKRWKSENFLFPDAIGHHIQNVTVHDGEWDSHGGIKIWNYTLGHVMELFKVYDLIGQFIPKTEDSCICKITMVWEKRNDEVPEPSSYMKLLKSMVVDMEDHVLKA
ncbi:unnamed protein product [Brassica napus]|uniref:(rape) hypothetical protein n=1 Tax=Brassica napus TaxID=3708 RepID=A0A816NGI6_BRANA|nr:unnamed protein product [Brassica napus]